MNRLYWPKRRIAYLQRIAHRKNIGEHHARAAYRQEAEAPGEAQQHQDAQRAAQLGAGGLRLGASELPARGDGAELVQNEAERDRVARQNHDERGEKREVER